MLKTYGLHVLFVISFIAILLGYILMYPYVDQDNQITLSSHWFTTLLVLGYLYMLFYHFYTLTFIYHLTKMGFETLYQIIGALFIVFSLMLYIPKMILFSNLSSTTPMFGIKGVWTILLILFIIQTLIMTFQMMLIIIKRPT